jgi:hypothetical protein
VSGLSVALASLQSMLLPVGTTFVHLPLGEPQAWDWGVVQLDHFTAASLAA